MKKIMSILEAIDAKAQDLDARHWQPFLRHLDRYFRKPRHADRTVGADLEWTGWGIIARVRNDRMLAALGY